MTVANFIMKKQHQTCTTVELPRSLAITNCLQCEILSISYLYILIMEIQVSMLIRRGSSCGGMFCEVYGNARE